MIFLNAQIKAMKAIQIVSYLLRMAEQINYMRMNIVENRVWSWGM